MADGTRNRRTRADKGYRRAFAWSLFWTWLLLDVAAVAVLGIVVTFFNAYSDEVRVPPIITIGMAAPMGLVIFVLLYAVRQYTVHAVDELGSAMHRVAEGDFSVRLDPAHAQAPLAQIYEDFNTMTEELEASRSCAKGLSLTSRTSLGRPSTPSTALPTSS